MAPPKKAAQSNNASAIRTVRVRALQRGYWDHKIWEEGVVFDYTLLVDRPLPTWMEEVRSRSHATAAAPEDPVEEGFGPTFTDDVI